MALTGPFVVVAVLCKEAVKNADGTLTINRILDGITVGVQTGRAFPAVVPVTAVIAIQAGDVAAHGEVSLMASDPLGATAEVARFPATLAADENLTRVLILRLQLERPGDYRFEVRFDGTTLTRMRLGVQGTTVH